MESKRKTRQVLKERKATLAPKESPKPQDKSAEAIIVHNANLVEELYKSEVWNEIIFPLISEGIASVSGRFTNGRYYYGEMSKLKENEKFLIGYQKALIDMNNWINDFIIVRDKQKLNKAQEELEKKAPIYNPFMEEEQ